MNKLIIKRLKFLNFKAFRDFEVSFNNDATRITADNGRGKSTIVAGFCWLLTGKDQFDSADVNAIKTHDENNVIIPQVDHSVEGVFLLNGREISIKRLLREKWVTKRGETVAIMEGHTTDYFINGVACGTEREFKEEIEQIIPDKLFKLLTNPLYFSAILSWQERREILFQIAPPVGDEAVLDSIATLQNKDRVNFLTALMNQGVSIERQKKDIAAKKKERKEQLSKIPAMITAAERTKPEAPDGGFGVVELQIRKLTAQLGDIDIQLSDRTKANEALLKKQREKQETINNLKLALQKAEYEAKHKKAKEREMFADAVVLSEREIESFKKEIKRLQEEIDENTKSIKNLEERKEFALAKAPELKAKIDALLEEFYKVDGSTFTQSDADGICPLLNMACNSLRLSKVGEAEKAFNLNKSKRLDEINATGQLLQSDKKKYEENMSKFDADIEAIENKSLDIAQAQAEINEKIAEAEISLEAKRKALAAFDANNEAPASEDAEKLKEQIASAESDKKQEDGDSNENNELIAEKKELQSQLDQLKAVASRKEQIAKTDKQIEEYKETQARLAQEIATLDGQEDAISEFTRSKIASIESRIAGLFKLTRFKLFNTLINGEIVECCEGIDPAGTPISITNTAMKTGCGIDIINALSEFYGYSAPIFIDNKESISNIPDTNNQVVFLEKVTGQQLNVE